MAQEAVIDPYAGIDYTKPFTQVDAWCVSVAPRRRAAPRRAAPRATAAPAAPARRSLCARRGQRLGCGRLCRL